MNGPYDDLVELIGRYISSTSSDVEWTVLSFSENILLSSCVHLCNILLLVFLVGVQTPTCEELSN